jgi:hypothetical protein
MKNMMKTCLAVWAVVVSQTSWAGPILSNDIVVVGGREWVQVDLFKNNSWDTINGQCPAGVCSTGSVLNGWDLNGWTWASIEDVQGLFNTFTAQSTTSPGTYRERDSTWAPLFFASFRPNYEDSTAQIVRGWASTKQSRFNAFIPILWHHTSAVDGSDFASSAGFMTSRIESDIGAWFTRHTTNEVAVPPTLALFGLGLGSVWMSRRKKQVAKV